MNTSKNSWRFVGVLIVVFLFCGVSQVAASGWDENRPNIWREYCYTSEFGSDLKIFRFYLSPKRGGNYLLTGRIEEKVKEDDVCKPSPVLTTFPVLGNMVDVNGVKLIHFTFSRLIRQTDTDGRPIYPIPGPPPTPGEYYPVPEWFAEHCTFRPDDPWFYTPENVFNAGTIFLYDEQKELFNEMSWGWIQGVSVSGPPTGWPFPDNPGPGMSTGFWDKLIRIECLE